MDSAVAFNLSCQMGILPAAAAHSYFIKLAAARVLSRYEGRQSVTSLIAPVPSGRAKSAFDVRFQQSAIDP